MVQTPSIGKGPLTKKLDSRMSFGERVDSRLFIEKT
jgi:hypothetical protein